jgi:hypothetical protein
VMMLDVSSLVAGIHLVRVLLQLLCSSNLNRQQRSRGLEGRGGERAVVVELVLQCLGDDEGCRGGCSSGGHSIVGR